MSKDYVAESLCDSELYQAYLKGEAFAEQRTLVYLASKVLVDEIGDILAGEGISVDVRKSPLVAASPIGVRLASELFRERGEHLGRLIMDEALRELVYLQTPEGHGGLDSAAFASKDAMFSKSREVGRRWVEHVLTRLRGTRSGRTFADCFLFLADDERSEMQRELDSFVMEYPIRVREAGILALQYEAQMMGFLYRYHRVLGLGSSIPKPLPTPSLAEGGEPYDDDLSILDLIERNHQHETPEALYRYFGLSRLSPLSTPSAAAALTEKLFYLEQLLVRAVYRPGRDLAILWNRLGLVHSALTSLSHQSSKAGFRIEWHADTRLGVVDYSTFVRDFNEGTKYPNLRWSGLADFEHVCRARKNRHGFEALAKSFAEVIIIAACACVNNIPQEYCGLTIGLGLSEVLANQRGNYREFWEAWNAEEIGGLIGDVINALHTDQLDMHHIVRGAELFVLNLVK